MKRTLIRGGFVSVGRVAEWTAIILAGAWVSIYGSPYAQAAYSVGGTGVLRQRGTVGSGTGIITTLPVELRPTTNLFFMVHATGGVGRVLITASTGAVSLFAGTGTEVDLSSVQFRISQL